MRRTAVSCLGWIVLFGLVVAINHRLLSAISEAGLRLALAAASALFLSLGLMSFWGLLRGYGSGRSSRNALLQRAKDDTLPADKEPVIASGTVRSLCAPLIAPLTRTPCAMYQYRMYYTTVDSKGDRMDVPVYWGYAARPFAIDSRSARYRILAVPRLSIAPVLLPQDSALAQARTVASSTQFERVRPDLAGTLQTVFESAKDIFLDDDGESRKDWAREGDERDPSELILEEIVLPVDVQASALGTWSQERNAIVSSKASTGNIGVSIVLGGVEKLTAKEGVPHSFTGYLVTAVLLTALGAGLLWLGMKVIAK